METTSLSNLVQFAGNLGTFVVVIYLVFKTQDTIKEKDGRLEKLNDQVLQAFKQNALSMQELSESIKSNTRSNETLTERVTDVLIGRAK